MSAEEQLPDGPFWPWPGQPVPHLVLPYLPPPRFAAGERVGTRWGSGTVIRVLDWALFESRAYLVRLVGSSAPPGFGHRFGEDDLTPMQQEPEAAAVEPLSLIHDGQAGVQQLALFDSEET